MKKTIVITLLAFLAMPAIYSQIKIGDNPQNIDAASVLELESNDRVLVITRINTAQMNAIVPNQGAMVYNTDTQCIHYFDGGQWINLCNSAGLEFTTDPIVNDVSTIVITDQAGTKNFEVAPNSIGTEQIINGGINGVDIQNGSIGPGKLQNQSVTQDKLSENSVGAFALDNDNIGLSAFNNDVGFITGANIVSGDTGNNIMIGGDNGAFYDNQPVLDAIDANTAAINAHIAADADTNANNEIQTLTLSGNDLGITGGNTITLPGGGNPTDELTDLSFNPATNILTLTNPATLGNLVDLSSLAGGGGNQDLAQVLTQGNDGGSAQIRNIANPTMAQDAATKAYVDANIGGNQNLDQVLTQGNDGGASLIKNILDPVDPQDAATKAYVDANGGSQNLDEVLTQGNDGGASLIKNILDPVDNQDAATKAYVDAAVTAGGSLTDGSILIGGIGDVAQQLPVIGDATIDNTGGLTISDDAVELGMLAHPDPMGTPAPANGDIIEWDNDNAEWVIAAPTSHSGTPKSIFFADVNGDPAQAVHPTNGNPMFIWDYESRVVGGNAYGTLGIGLDDTDINKNVKVHIEDTDANDLTFPLELQNSGESPGTGLGILFANDRFNDGKGALVFERQGSFGVGDFHFLHNTNNGAREAPDLATDKAFTVKNNSDIVLYGGIDIDGIGTGTAGQVLTSTGAGIQWGAGGGSVTVVSADANNAISASVNDGGAFYDDSALTTVTAANTAALLLKEDLANKSTDIALGTSDTEYPSQNAVKTYVDAQIASVSSGTNLSNTNLTQTAGNRTYDLPTTSENLIFTGLGNVGIGNGANPPSNKLHVAGAIRAQGILNSDGTNGTPSYRFNGDPDTGMYSDVADDLAFSAGGQEILRLSESGANGLEIVATGSLELEAELIDLTGDVGNSGQILSSTGAGVEWINAPTGGADGVVSNIATSGTELVVTGINGGFNGNVDLETLVDVAAGNNGYLTAEVDGDIMNEIQTMSSTGPTMTVTSIGGTNNYTFAVGVITDANVATGAAIDGTKINPNFGGQNIATTGNINGNAITTTGNLLVGGSISTVTSGFLHADYVFEKYFDGVTKFKSGYDFKSLEEIEAFIKNRRHLPGIKSTAQVIKEGVWNLSESNLQNLEKIEELFLHTIEQEKKIKALQSENDTLTNELNSIKKDLEEIKAILKKSN